MIFLYSMTLTIGLLFFFMNHPISMMILIITYVIPISILIGMNLSNFWYSYIIILIYLGGLLILFLYITSLASNEKSLFKITWTFKYSIITLLLTISSLLMILPDQILNLDSQQMFTQIFNSSNNSFTTIFSESTSKITIFLAAYLLLCLISVVKICNLTEGPIRPL